MAHTACVEPELRISLLATPGPCCGVVVVLEVGEAVLDIGLCIIQGLAWAEPAGLECCEGVNSQDVPGTVPGQILL